MQKNNSLIRILPQDRQIRVENGATLLENFIRHGIFLRSDCGGKGVCGKCRVFKISKDGAQEPIESCMYGVSRDLAVHIPESAMLSSHIMTKAPVIFPEAFKRRFKYKICARSPSKARGATARWRSAWAYWQVQAVRVAGR